MTGVLAELARLGPLFALESHAVRSTPAAAWRPLAELLQPAGLGARVSTVRAALAEVSGQPADAVELRVAASMAQLGLAGRLVCPALGVAALTGAVLDLEPSRTWWRAGAEGTVALAVPADLVPASAGPADPVAGGVADSSAALGLADSLAARLLNGPVRALVDAARTFGVSEQVLWGNVASVVHGALALIATAAPELSARAEPIVAGLLDRPPLQGTYQDGTYQDGTPQDGSHRDGFRRRSCCLVYRLAGPPAPVCGDCVLALAPIRRVAEAQPG